MSTKRNKAFYWLFKILGVIVACALPVWGICEKFPLWTTAYGQGQSIGVGSILILIVVLMVFRKSVFKFVEEKLKLRHAPPIVAWLVLLVISYILLYIANFLKDLTTVLWLGVIGCGIGMVLTFIAENRHGKEKSNE